MKVTPSGRLVALASCGLLALSACGSSGSGSGSQTTPSSGATSGGAGQAADMIGGVPCASSSIMASGSSAQKNALDAWTKAYSKACSGAQINYQPVGSGAGVQQFLAGSTAFAGSDSALKPEEMQKAMARCGGNPAIDLPMVTGPIAVAYNLSGVDTMVLDAPTIAKIFSGQITSWDDPAIKALNSGASLPGTPIQAIHRSDDSGTTDNFTKYLSAAAPAAWTFGTGKTWTARGGTGGKGSDGVTAAVKQTDGAITYVESSFAENASLGVAKIDTGAGEPVALTADAASKAVAAAQVVGTGEDLSLKIDYATKAPGAYPVVLVTYEIVCSKGGDDADMVKSFLGYTSSTQGQAVLNDLSYAPLPDQIRTKVAGTIASIS